MRLRLDELIDLRDERSMLRLAARAGISPATMYRYARAQTEPKIGDLMEIAYALGDVVEIRQRPAFEQAAARAARWMLGDSSLPADETTEAWVARLERLSDAVERPILLEASRLAKPRNDPAAVFLAADVIDPDRLASAGDASGRSWALSGAAAFDALGFEVDGPVVLWVDEPNEVRQLLGQRFTRTHPDRAGIIVVKGDGSVFDGVINIDGINLVTPIQAAIDSAEHGGTLGQRARELAESMS